MKKQHIFAATMTLALMLGGCSYDEMHDVIPRGPWKTEAKRHSNFETFSLGHSKGEKHKLEGLLAKATLPTPVYARIVVQDVKKTGPLSKRASGLRRELMDLGVPAHRIDIQHLDPVAMVIQKHGKHKSVMVIIDQYEVIPPNCPGWKEYMDAGEPPELEAHFGCVSERNFAHMVAEPKDIYEASKLADGDGAFLSKSVDRYRKDTVKSPSVDAGSGSSSSASTGAQSSTTQMATATTGSAG